MQEKTKKMDDEIYTLKSNAVLKNENKSDSNQIKNYIIYFLIIFLLISISLNMYLYIYKEEKYQSNPVSKNITTNERTLNNNNNKYNNNKYNNNKYNNNINNNNFIQFNTYNIYMDNIHDFYSSKFLMLLPGNNCPNRNLKTYFFKPRYPSIAPQYIKFQEKNISLKTREESDPIPSVFTTDKEELREIFLKRMGFELHTTMNVSNLYSTPYSISYKLKREISQVINSKYQKISRFYSYSEYVSKSLLYINYEIFADKFPSDYNYMLETYSYPDQKEEIEEKFKNYKLKNNNDIWMVKPNLGSLGLQISLLTNYSQIKLKKYLITKYLHNPHLIKGYKYDLRFHALVSSIKPLKLYLYNEGLARLASEKYNFSISDPHNKYSFLTNLFINKKNKGKFVYPKDLIDMEESNLWNLETFQRYCARNNISYDKIISEVGDIFIKMMLTVRNKIIKDIQKTNLDTSNFYHIIGFDIILDENLKPYLLETNRRCGIRNDNDAEKYYTYNMIADTLNILGLRPLNLNVANQMKNKEELIKENVEESLCELDRPRGGYKLIFPLKNNVEKYKKFYEDNIPEEDQELWKQLFE